MLFRAYLVAVALLLIVITVFTGALYEWGTGVVRRWGWERVARLRDRMRPWALPFSRILLLAIAAACLVAALVL